MSKSQLKKEQPKNQSLPDCCQDCVFFFPKAHLPTVGLCKRYPRIEERDCSDWCGEFREVGVTK